jgi:hypothetical protein
MCDIIVGLPVCKILHRGFQTTSNRAYLAVLMAQNFRRKLWNLRAGLRLADKMMCCDLLFLRLQRLSVVVVCQRLRGPCGNTSCRLRTKDHGKRSCTQNVTLKPNSVGRTLSVWGTIRRRMGRYQQQIGYAIASAWNVVAVRTQACHD